MDTLTERKYGSTSVVSLISFSREGKALLIWQPTLAAPWLALDGVLHLGQKPVIRRGNDQYGPSIWVRSVLKLLARET